MEKSTLMKQFSIFEAQYFGILLCPIVIHHPIQLGEVKTHLNL
ncbi:MAG: hypothetical protein SWJ54_17465 [Cyanobacteriota bacterium]|nr:hypothetical protein [Cyanobacteriota bacterium]